MHGLALGHGEMMHLMMAALHHNAHEAQRTDLLHVGRVAGGDRQFHAIRQSRCPHRPAIHSVDVAGMLGHHALDRLQRAVAAGHLDAQAVLDRLLLCCRSHRHFVHVDQMLPQGIDIDLGPVGVRIGLQPRDDLLDRAERGLTGFRGDCGLLAWLMHHHAAHRMMHRH